MNHLDTSFLAEAFSSSLPLPSVLDPNFEDALRHVLDNPGSLVRPRLVFQMASAYGLGRVPAQELAVALEYFHTASLLFDDLPCMDNALERRSAPCTHLVFGEEGAILTALALINRAYALTWRAVASCPKARQPRALAFIETLPWRGRIAQRTKPRPPLLNFAPDFGNNRTHRPGQNGLAHSFDPGTACHAGQCLRSRAPTNRADLGLLGSWLSDRG
jgi:hypothetical protein